MLYCCNNEIRKTVSDRFAKKLSSPPDNAFAGKFKFLFFFAPVFLEFGYNRCYIMGITGFLYNTTYN